MIFRYFDRQKTEWQTEPQEPSLPPTMTVGVAAQTMVQPRVKNDQRAQAAFRQQPPPMKVSISVCYHVFTQS